MERKISKISRTVPSAPIRKRVVAYARVSGGKDAMLHSLAAQVGYYSSFIQSHSDWQYVGVYADEACTGTRDSRAEFQRMLSDCREGKVDMIITKSISRFARNTVTLLETVRMLKALEVDVYFEEQNIHTMSGDGELMLSILASYAQEESLSASENQKWRIKRNFENGMPWTGTMLGYRYDNGKYVIVPGEAKTVRLIFDSYLDGMGITSIMKMLNEKGIISRNGNAWCKSSVMCVLQNYSYTGNLLLQQTYRENHLTKRTLQNNGELPKYHITDSHDPIIPLRQFNAVQEEIRRRAEKHTHPGVKQKTYPFTGLVICGSCGKHYRRKVTKTGSVWICSTFNTLGKAYCASKQIPENTLISVTGEVVGGIDTLRDKITTIRAEKDNTLIFCFKDGSESVKRWQDRSRAESWTKEMKEEARQKALERRKSNG